MPVRRLGAGVAFPDPAEAEPGGLLAVGGDLRPERLLAAYAAGIFPWYDEAPILWFSPDPRMVLVPDALHVPRRLERTLRQGRFRVRFDTAFRQVIEACAEARRGVEGTWITPEMVEAYCALHALGCAHSAECWLDGRLVGGVYGVSLGGAFFAESMFHAERDASKVALVSLVRELARRGFSVVDCQQYSDHLACFGAQEWPRARFLEALAPALRAPIRRGPWTAERAGRVAGGAVGPDTGGPLPLQGGK